MHPFLRHSSPNWIEYRDLVQKTANTMPETQKQGIHMIYRLLCSGVLIQLRDFGNIKLDIS